MGMFPAYAIDNDLNYVADKVRNFYEVGEYKTDAEMGQADAAVASDLEKPDIKGRRARGGRNTANTEQAEQSKEESPKSGRTSRTSGKTHDEVVAENNQKIAEHMEAVEKAIDEAAGSAEEIPFDEACTVADKVPKPELETPPRRTRKERVAKTEQNEQPENTPNVLVADTYFYIEATDNYVMKRKGDVAPEGGKVISKEEFGEGIKRLARTGNPKADQPEDNSMNPPEQPPVGASGRRVRRTRQ